MAVKLQGSEEARTSPGTGICVVSAERSWLFGVAGQGKSGKEEANKGEYPGRFFPLQVLSRPRYSPFFGSRILEMETNHYGEKGGEGGASFAIQAQGTRSYLRNYW